MLATQDHPRSRTPTLGELLVGGDWACSHGDLAALGHVAGQLAQRATGQLRSDLLALENRCRFEPECATAAWIVLKDRIRRGAT